MRACPGASANSANKLYGETSYGIPPQRTRLIRIEMTFKKRLDVILYSKAAAAAAPVDSA